MPAIKLKTSKINPAYAPQVEEFIRNMEAGEPEL